MNMKRISIIILSAFALASCVDMLNVSPANEIASANMWSNESLADKGMAGLYRNFYKKDLTRIQLRHNDMTGINRQGWAGMEFAVDFVSDNYPLMALSKAKKDATEFLVWYEWKWAYTSIHQINDAIANLHKAGLSQAKYDRYMCEAKFLRAWFYARLNKIYGGLPKSDNPAHKGGVPVYLEVVSENECTRTQTPVEEVWNIIIQDLNDCINNPNFPDNTLTANYGRPSKGAAYALRGLAYIYLEEWEQAAKDLEKVAECGYGYWEGKYIDFFHYNNEKNKEMIFPLQFNEDAGYCDNLQLMMGGRDSWNSWSNLRAAADFVDYYQNQDGSKFEWTQVIPEWNDPAFVSNPEKREVFFLRNNMKEGGNWSSNEKKQINEILESIGSDIISKYYLNTGNEDRIRSAYANRDPRLLQTILTPYEPYDTFKDATDNGGKIQKGKELRWPFLKEGDDYGDYYTGDRQNMYLFKKYVYTKPDDLVDRLRCPTDWPLIRYTDVALLLAEAYANSGKLSDAVDIVNRIRTRAGMPGVSVGSLEDVMEAIRYERRIELCFEGHTFFDEWRWGTYKQIKFQGNDIYGGQSWWKTWKGFNYNWYYTEDMYPWAAPAGECQRNPNLVKKEGWAY